MAAENAAFDLEVDDELFNFDELLREAHEAVTEVSFAIEASTSPSTGEAEPSPAAPTFKPPQKPPPLSPAQVAARSRPPVLAAPAAPASRESRRVALSPAIAGAVAGLLFLNLALVAFVVHTLRSVQGMVRDVESQVVATGEVVRDQVGELANLRQADPLEIAPTSTEPAPGEAALERARAALQQGEFERARQIAYALLSVVDRIEPQQRLDMEARARFLLADAWRLEADAEASATAAAEPADAGEEPQ